MDISGTYTITFSDGSIVQRDADSREQAIQYAQQDYPRDTPVLAELVYAWPVFGPQPLAA